MRAIAIVPKALLPALLLAGAGAAAGGPARAAPDSPPLMPTRDAVVLYDVQPEGAPQPQPVRVYFRAGGGLMRIDGPPGADGASSGAMILDRDGKTMTVIMNQPRIYMQIPEHNVVRSPFVLDASMHFTRTGTGTVAGIPCVQWSITTGKGDATACVAADGVVLSESGVDGEGAKGQMIARTVQYGPVDPKLFAPPAGFTRTAHPEGLGAGMGGGPGGMSSSPTLSAPPPADGLANGP